MEKDEAIFGQYKFAKVHVLIGAVFTIFSLILFVSGNSIYGIKGFLFIGALEVLDICILKVNIKKHTKVLLAIRYAQLILVSYAFLLMLGQVVSNFFGIYLGLIMFEIISLTDITDSYTRRMTLLLTSAPYMIIMILYLVIQRKDYEDLFGMVCIAVTIILFIDRMSAMVAEQVVESDKKIFEQRRLAERTNEAFDELRKQQEKVKKANEELGAQKIKLEAAYEKINSVNAEMTIQNVILKYITSSLEINRLMELITGSILESCGLHICALVLEPKVSSTQNLTYKIKTRLSKNSEELLSEQIMTGCFEEYIISKEIFVDNQVQENKYPFLFRREIESLLIIPLVMSGESNGALICGHSQSDFFGDNKDFFETIVAQFMMALHNADMYSTMEHMAKRDSLTGIYNRGHLNALVDKYSKEASHNNTPLSVALIDIDHFKRINDTYGHLFGDEVIKKIAEFADAVATKYGGFSARYGGEEFVMVFPHKEVSDCIRYVEEMRLLVQEMELVCDGHIVTTRISVGIASYPETCKRVQELLGRADGAMYYSKICGRDKVSVDSQEIQNYVKQNRD